MISCASLALADAGVMMYDLVASASLVCTPSLLLSLSLSLSLSVSLAFSLSLSLSLSPPSPFCLSVNVSIPLYSRFPDFFFSSALLLCSLLLTSLYFCFLSFIPRSLHISICLFITLSPFLHFYFSLQVSPFSSPTHLL